MALDRESLWGGGLGLSGLRVVLWPLPGSSLTWPWLSCVLCRKIFLQVAKLTCQEQTMMAHFIPAFSWYW